MELFLKNLMTAMNQFIEGGQENILYWSKIQMKNVFLSPFNK